MLLLAIGAALADDYVPGSDVTAQAEKPSEGDDAVPNGWSPKFEIGLNGSLMDSRKVVGQSDGTTLQMGLLLQAAADLHQGRSDWENHLVIAHTQTRTPTIDAWVKTNDNFELTSNYFLALPKIDWIGPFARAKAQTQLLPGSVVFAADTALQIDGAVDGTGAPITEPLLAQTKRKVTGAFEPLSLRQAVGAFMRPLKKDELTLTVTAGAGAIEILANEGFAVADDADTTDRVELVTIPDSIQAGAEAEIVATGAPTANTTYTLSANALYPFFVSTDTDLAGLDLLNVDLNGKLSVKLAKWLSVDYVLTVKRAPLVADVWQVQNGILLSSAFNLIKEKAAEAAPPPPPCTPCAPVEPVPPIVPDAPPAPETPTTPATAPDAPPAPEPPPAPVP